MNTRRGFLKDLVCLTGLLIIKPFPTITKVLKEPRLWRDVARPTFNLQYLPLPIIGKDFKFAISELLKVRDGRRQDLLVIDDPDVPKVTLNGSASRADECCTVMAR